MVRVDSERAFVGEPAVNVFGGELDELACAERGDDVAVGEDAASSRQ